MSAKKKNEPERVLGPGAVGDVADPGVGGVQPGLLSEELVAEAEKSEEGK